VGKSTLFNRITKSKSAIVDPSPGVTRDRHYERTSWNNKSFILIDTGGIDRDREQTMAARIREQTLQAIREADSILFVLDAKAGIMPDDYEIVDLLRRSAKPIFYLVNKIDGPEAESVLLPQFYELGVTKLLPISAAHGYGVRTLLDELTLSLPRPEKEDQPQQKKLTNDIIRLAFLGRPNVGKSSLINRILGEERMVVSEIAGTTRDSVDTLLTRGDKKYLLIDTAGIRRKGKVSGRLEKFSVIRALASLERCDIALLLIDAKEGITDQDTKIIGYSLDSGRGCILIVNKWDLVEKKVKNQKRIFSEIEMATPFVGFAPLITVSALTGFGVRRIFPSVEEVYEQYRKNFSTNSLNLLLQEAITSHPPPLHKGKRLKLLYTTQIATAPPTFAIVANYPKEIHFSYHRYLINRFRKGLGLDKVPIRILFRERKRKKLK